MNKHKTLTIWTLISHFLIIIAAGHGAGPIGLFEIGLLLNLIGLDDSLDPDGLFTSPLYWSIALALVGQILIIISIPGKLTRSLYFKLAGILCLLLSLILIIAFVWHDGTAAVSFITGLPFLVLAGVLLYKNQGVNFQEIFMKNIERLNDSLVAFLFARSKLVTTKSNEIHEFNLGISYCANHLRHLHCRE